MTQLAESATVSPAPEISADWTALAPPNCVSYRRHLIDAHLEWARPLMRGLVIDLGGKREGKRGRFRPPSSGVNSWIHVNVAMATRPDVFASATDVPLGDGCADCVICTEVLEHLSEPRRCVSEAYRLLKPGGVLIASVPFMYPVHGDPGDFQRFTSDGIRHLVSAFRTVDVRPMGGYFGTLGLFLELGLERFAAGGLWRRVARRLISITARILLRADARRLRSPEGALLPAFANGFFFVARK